MVATPEMIWAPPAGPRVTLRVSAETTQEGDGEGPEGLGGIMQSRNASLFATWSGNSRPRSLLGYTMAAGGTCAEVQATVVYVGIRIDGRILVSMEALPQIGRMEIPGDTRRAIFEWDAATSAPRLVSEWQGPTANVPPLFRNHG